MKKAVEIIHKILVWGVIAIVAFLFILQKTKFIYLASIIILLFIIDSIISHFFYSGANKEKVIMVYFEGSSVYVPCKLDFSLPENTFFQSGYRPFVKERIEEGDIIYHFSIFNVNNAYTVESNIEKEEVMKFKDDKGRTMKYHVYNKNKIVCVEFVKPLKNFQVAGVLATLPDLEKIYLSVKDPQEFINKLTIK
jgi:hypothetical protein